MMLPKKLDMHCASHPSMLCSELGKISDRTIFKLRQKMKNKDVMSKFRKCLIVVGKITMRKICMTTVELSNLSITQIATMNNHQVIKIWYFFAALKVTHCPNFFFTSQHQFEAPSHSQIHIIYIIYIVFFLGTITL